MIMTNMRSNIGTSIAFHQSSHWAPPQAAASLPKAVISPVVSNVFEHILESLCPQRLNSTDKSWV